MMVNRLAAKEAFLRRTGWSSADRRHMAGDASARSYERLELSGKTAVLMDNPPGGPDSTEDFIRIARHLTGLGLSAPEIYEADVASGFLLLEDLGDSLFSHVLANDPSQEPLLYASAVDVLLEIQAGAPPDGLINLTAEGWAAAAQLAPQVYAAFIRGAAVDDGPLTTALSAALKALADGPRTMILRDYHAGNLLWLPDRKGVARVGVLDFQQAQMGQPGYDLVSLLQDARRDVPAPIEQAGLGRFGLATGLLAPEFAASYAAFGAQRALRILGIFARLCVNGGKPGYVPLIPRVWRQLQHNLSHPALTGLRHECQKILPEPTPENLARILSRCGTPLFP